MAYFFCEEKPLGFVGLRPQYFVLVYVQLETPF